MISTKFKAAPSHLKFEILPISRRRRRRNVPILKVLLFNLMLRFRANSVKRICHWPSGQEGSREGLEGGNWGRSKEESRGLAAAELQFRDGSLRYSNLLRLKVRGATATQAYLEH